MFDIKTANKRYFEIQINDLVLEVEPPKVKTLKKMLALSKRTDDEAMSELAEVVRMILGKNKGSKPVTIEVVDDLDIDELNEIITKYFEWIASVKKDPNL